MKRIKILGLCLMAACAFAAVSVASSASAAEFKVCVPMKKGYYANSTCSTVAMKKGVADHKGSYESEPGGACYAAKKSVYANSTCTTVAEKKGVPDHKGGYEKASGNFVATSGVAELVSAAGTIICTSSGGGGEITGANTSLTQTIFHGCETSGHECQSGTEAGTIATFPLAGTLTEEGHTVLTGIEKYGGYLAEFGCTEVAYVRVGGTLGGAQGTLNSYTTSNTIDFVEGVEQGLTSEFSGSLAFNPAETEDLPSIQRVDVTQTGKDAVEIGT